MLLEWGADPRRVSLGDLFDSYNSELMERFRTLGIDLSANHELAKALSYHTSNKPLFGFAKRRREHDPGIQRELNIALVHHAGKGNEKGVHLCLWAGADAHAPAPSLRFPSSTDREGDESDDSERFLGFTAIDEACSAGDARILERLGPDPCRDDFDELYRIAASGAVIELLARMAPPKIIGAVICSQVSRIAPPFGHPLDTLQRLFESGARWEISPAKEIVDLRRALLRIPENMFVEVLKLLARDSYCSPTILQDLGRTSTMRARMRKVGFFPSPPDERQDFYRSRRPDREKSSPSSESGCQSLCIGSHAPLRSGHGVTMRARSGLIARLCSIACGRNP